MLTERGVRILKLFIESSNAISIKELASFFDLSERSIRYDIKSINTILKDENLPVIQKQRSGVFKLNDKELVEEYINSLDSYQYTSAARRKHLLYKIALTNVVNLSSASKKLDISRTSIKSDIEKLKEVIKEFDLKLIHSHKKGLTLHGSEKNIRLLQLNILKNYLAGRDVEDLLINPIIDSFLEGINITIIDEFINNLEAQTNNILSDEGCLLLKTYIIIIVKRNINGYKLTKTDCNLEYLSSSSEFIAINNLSSKLESAFNINLSKEELLLMTDMFISSPSFTFPDKPYKNWFEVETYVTELVQQFSDIVNLDLTNDSELKRDLIILAKPAWFNNFNEVVSNNLTMEKIEELYPDIFKVVTDSLNKTKNFKKLQFSPKYKTLIVIAFIVAIERNNYTLNTTRNVLLICGHGYGSSKLLELQLRQKYDINIIDSLPIHHLKSYNKFDNIDIILSTAKLENINMNKPIIIVNPILSDEDYKKLDNLKLPKSQHTIRLSKLLSNLKPYLNIKDQQHIIELLKDNLGDFIVDDLSNKKNALLNLLPIENIKTQLTIDTWEEAIRVAGSILVTNGYVKENYNDALINAFKAFGSYMIIKEDIAIPHANSGNDILKTGMALITLKESVMTPFNKSIRVILVFSSFDNTEHLDALYEFASIIQTSNFLTLASEATTPIDLYHFIHYKKI